jgi:hypothetical protein
VPSPGDPRAWDRFAYALNNPLKYIDPTGHDSICNYPWGNDPDCGDSGGNNGSTGNNNNPGTGGNGSTGSGGSAPTDVELTEEGQLVYEYYQAMLRYPDAWWNENGMLDIATFLGLYTLHEANWLLSNDQWSATRADLVSLAVAHSLYVGSWADPTCTCSSCYNGVFNFIAERTHMYDSSGFISGIKNPVGYKGPNSYAALSLESARVYGNKALHPTKLNRNVVGGKRMGPSQWGNNWDRTNYFRYTLKLEEGKIYGSTGAVYYFMADFYVYSPYQRKQWDPLPGK